MCYIAVAVEEPPHALKAKNGRDIECLLMAISGHAKGYGRESA